ncbi:MAG: type IVB secretion system protein IcmW [Gammaproteobacteria bacterium]
MPDLSPDAVAKHWQEKHDYALYRIISTMEAVESWALDGDPEFEALLAEIGTSVDGLTTFTVSEEESFIKTFNAIKASRALRLLQSIDQLMPGSASKLLVFAEVSSSSKEDTPGFFLNRNLVFERLQLLGRIFAPERFRMVMSALEKAE